MPLDISEYDRLSLDQSGRSVLVGVEPARANQQLAIGVAVQSAAFGDNTRFVRLHADAACRVLFGANPTATGTSMRLAAGATEYFGVRPGEKLSVVSSS